MIPKIIHYCWFGKGELPKLAQKCIDSWNKYMEDYKIMVWSEENFDINMNKFVSEAYSEKKWAFVSDYVRLYALYNHGGIYLDTDVEIIKKIDDYFLSNKGFTGFENDINIPTGIMASEKNNSWVKELLDYYKNKSFYKENGELDLTTNVEIISNISKKFGFIPNSKKQVFHDGIAVYPKDYFCPKDYETGKINITKNTYCIHHFSGSWKDKTKLYYFQKIFTLFMGKKLGEKTGSKLFWKLYHILNLE